jgi:proline iminopeptidase
MELCREHLGIEKWLLNGGSWGSTLILAYAERHPERVTAAVIPGVTTLDRAAVSWWYEGTSRFFPEAYERFRAHIPAEQRGEDIFDLINAYGRLMTHPDPEVRARTAEEWLTWEDVIVSLEPNGTADNYRNKPDDAAAAFVRICAHYFGNGVFLEEGELIRNAGKLKGIPAVLAHGRHDLGGPAETAWNLAKAWSDSELLIIEDVGHTGSPAYLTEIRGAMDRLTAGL